MAKKSIFEQLVDAMADFIIGFIVICLLLIPLAYMRYGIEGVAILVFTVIVIGSCILLSSNDDKKGNNYSSKNKSNKFYNKRIFENETNDNAKNYKICKKCNYINKANDSICWKCSSKLNRKRMSKKEILNLEKK